MPHTHALRYEEPALRRASRQVVRRALDEDLGTGDVTTLATVPARAVGRARIVAKASIVVCGLPSWMDALDAIAPGTACLLTHLPEGTRAVAGQELAELEAPARALLATERVAMNLVCHLSGVATLTARFVEAAGALRVLDTRKTTPGLRTLEKYAVRVGGGHNHRLGLDGGILIKENHITAAGSLETAIQGARDRAPHSLRIECEVQNLDEAARALDAGAEALLLDNFTDEDLETAARRFGARAFLEASGNMSPERARALAPLAALGLDAISAGALTHSRPYADLSMLLELQSPCGARAKVSDHGCRES